jgi:hypothetical protein
MNEDEDEVRQSVTIHKTRGREKKKGGVLPIQVIGNQMVRSLLRKT